MANQTLSLDCDAYVDYILHEDLQALTLNNRNINNIRLKHIRYITVTNFKSFAGRHEVGPFTDLTAVIGPNGGGKSNVLDAIAFTLGLTVRDLRCGSSEELIYSKQQYYEATTKKQQEDPEEAAASVELVFTSNFPEIVRLKRTLNLNGHSSTYINDIPFTEKEFGIFLLQSKIHVPSKNFLLIQGEADVLATTPPAEMTELFEKLSGSILYKKECQQLEKKLDSVQQQITTLSYNKASLKTEQKKLKSLQQTSAQYQTINNEIDLIKQKIKLLSLHIIDEDINSTKEKSLETENSQINQIDNRHQIIVDLQKTDQHIKQQQKLLINLQQEIDILQTNLKDQDNQQNESEQNQKFINQSTNSFELNIHKLEKELENQNQMVEEVELDLFDKKEQQDKLINENEDMKIPDKYIQEYTALQSDFKNEHFLMESEYKKLQQQEQFLTELSQLSETAWRQSQTQFNLNVTETSMEQGEYDQLAQQSQLYQERLEYLKDKLNSLEVLHKSQQNELNRVLQLKSEQQRIIQLHEISMTQHIEEEESKRVVQQLSATLPKFMGELSGLINPVSLQWSDSLKLVFGQKLLCALVVQDASSSVTVNQLLKTMGVVKNIIILDKAKSIDEVQQLENRKNLEILIENYRKGGKGKQQRNGKALLAIDALEYDKVVEKVVTFLVRGTILTDSYQLAVEIQQARLPGVYQVITQDGVQLQLGMLMSNQKVTTMRNFRQNNNKQNKITTDENISKAQKQMEYISAQIRALQTNSIESQLKEASSQKAEAEEQLTIILIQMKQKERPLKQLKNQEINLKEKMTHSRIEFDQKNNQILEVKQRIQNIKKDLLSEQSRMFIEFARKTNLPQDKILSIADSDQMIKKREALENLINKLNSSKVEMITNCQLIYKKILEMRQEIQQKFQKTQLLLNDSLQFKERKTNLFNNLNNLADKESELQKEIKSQLKKIKDLVEKRDKIIRKNLDVQQMINQYKLKINLLYVDKQKLIEECEMESIEISLKIKDEEQIDQEIDYSIINDDLQTDDSTILLQQFQDKLKQKEKESTKYLSENLQVGLIGDKSDQKFNKIENEIKDLAEKLSVHYEVETEVEDLLKKAKKERSEKFNNFFKIVSDEIDTLYKTLTFQENTQLGGSALLYLENQQDPYKGGIIYTTTPPNKKYVFDNSEQLSGGEKAMASVALQFALNSALGTPFLLLDEIDANLDPDNTLRLRMVMQALAGKPIQFITISHNIEMFGKAKSLIGVTIQNRRLTSEAFSMLLE